MKAIYNIDGLVRGPVVGFKNFLTFLLPNNTQKFLK